MIKYLYIEKFKNEININIGGNFMGDLTKKIIASLGILGLSAVAFAGGNTKVELLRDEKKDEQANELVIVEE